MNNLITDLESFSKSNDLWQTTRKLGLECLENLLKENEGDLSILNISDIIFEKASQSLVFWSSTNTTPLIRTTFDLFKNSELESSVGYYSLDVDQDGKVIDDWLVFY